jgi:hypothetical protein
MACIKNKNLIFKNGG